MSSSVLITGCSSGIGRATAERFAEAGYRVFATMRDPSKGVDLAEKAAVNDWLLETPRLDVTDRDSVEETMGSVHERVGALDVLVNNAGLGMLAPVEDVDDADLARLFDTNVFGVVRVTRSALPPMRERRSGVIVNVSSFGATQVFPYYGFYHATKWAVEAITEALYMEVQPFGIRVHSVMPGLVASGFGANTVRAPRVAAKESAYGDDIKRLIAGFIELLPGNRVEPSSPAQAILEAAESGGARLRHPSDPFAAAEIESRRTMPEQEWFAHFRSLLRID